MPRFLFLLICLAGALPVGASPSGDVLAVVVPRQYNGKLPDAQELSLIFKRKKLFWEDGSRIQPINLPADHVMRRLFSRRILRSPPESQAQYWNGMYYHGVFPPHVVASPEAMLRLVSGTLGAVGYLPACKVDERVRVVMWVTESGPATIDPPEFDCSGD